MIDSLAGMWVGLPAWLQTTLTSLGQILAVTIVVILCVAYLTLAERKVLGKVVIEMPG